MREELHRLSLAVAQLQVAITALAQHEQDQREKLLLQFKLDQKQLPPQADE